MKKKVYSLLLFIIIFFSGVFLLGKEFPVFKYLVGNIILVNKYSPYFSNSILFMDLEFMVKNSDLIILGEVVSNGETMDIPFNRTKDEIEKDSRLGLKTETYAVTHSKIKVEKVISGRSKGEEITISQLGTANVDSSEVKVKKGDALIFLLRKHPNTKELYSSVNLSDGLYRIKDTGKIDVISEKDAFKKYDDMEKNEFMREIKKLRMPPIPLMTIYLIVIIFISFNCKKLKQMRGKKLFWIIPFGNFAIATLILISEIMSLRTDGSSIVANINFFFNTEAIIHFYTIYIPCIIVGTIAPLLSSKENSIMIKPR